MYITDCPKDYNAIFKTNLRTLREAKGLTQDQFAIRLRFKKETYQSWEKGRRFPDTFSLLRLSEFFEVTINDLLSETVTLKAAA